MKEIENCICGGIPRITFGESSSGISAGVQCTKCKRATATFNFNNEQEARHTAAILWNIGIYFLQSNIGKQ